jgi:hypothetical protein
VEEDDVRAPFYRVVQVLAQRPEKLTNARFVFDVLRTRTAEIKKHDEDQPPQQYVNSNMYTAKNIKNFDNLFSRNHKRQRSEKRRQNQTCLAG